MFKAAFKITGPILVHVVKKNLKEVRSSKAGEFDFGCVERLSLVSLVQ